MCAAVLCTWGVPRAARPVIMQEGMGAKGARPPLGGARSYVSEQAPRWRGRRAGGGSDARSSGAARRVGMARAAAARKAKPVWSRSVSRLRRPLETLLAKSAR